MAYVVEATVYDPGAGVEKTMLFAMGEGIAFTDTDYAPGALVSWESPSQRIEIGAEGVVRIQGDGGRMVIANHPDSVNEVGPFDQQSEWIWQYRKASIYWVPARVWSQRVLCDFGVLEQPVSGIMGDRSILSFELKDPRSSLSTPFQTAFYAGTGGQEGPSDLKGQPKPIVYGLVSNLTPVLIDEALLIYQVADKAVSILCVRDGGVRLVAGTVRASYADLASPPAPVSTGGFYEFFSGPAGTFIRVVSRPVFAITVDADEADFVADQSHARIWSRIRNERMGGAVDAASVTATHNLDTAGAGFFFSEPVTQRDAIDEVLASFSGYEVLSLSGLWKVGKIVLPSGPTAFDLVMLQPNTRMGEKTRVIVDAVRVRPSYAPNGAPPYKVTVEWGRNYTIQGASDLAAGANARLKEKFAIEYRSAVAANNAIWDPIAQTGPWINAPELKVKSAYQPSDGIISTGAQAEADRLLALLGPLRAGYQVGFIPEPGDVMEPGGITSMTMPRMGLQTSPLFLILQGKLAVKNGRASASLVIGLQTQI